MKVLPVSRETEDTLPLALHGANKNLILTIIGMAQGKVLYGGVPAVLTDGVGFYSGELFDDPTERLYVVHSVNGYADKTEAWRDAERRA